MCCQVFAPLCPAENRIRDLSLQLGALRSVADHDQLQCALGIILFEGLEARFEQPQVLFRCQPADMNNADIRRLQAPTLAQ